MEHLSKPINRYMKKLAAQYGIKADGFSFGWFSGLLDRAIRQRKCHACNNKITKKNLHMALHFNDMGYGMKRYNICVHCLELLCKVIKKDFKNKGMSIKQLKNDRLIDTIIEEL